MKSKKSFLKILSSSEIYITENYERGVTFTVLQDGAINIEGF